MDRTHTPACSVGTNSGTTAVMWERHALHQVPGRMIARLPVSSRLQARRCPFIREAPWLGLTPPSLERTRGFLRFVHPTSRRRLLSGKESLSPCSVWLAEPSRMHSLRRDTVHIQSTLMNMQQCERSSPSLQLPCPVVARNSRVQSTLVILPS